MKKLTTNEYKKRSAIIALVFFALYVFLCIFHFGGGNTPSTPAMAAIAASAALTVFFAYRCT